MLVYKTRQQWDTAGKSNQMQAIYHEAKIQCGEAMLESEWISDNQRINIFSKKNKKIVILLCRVS